MHHLGSWDRIFKNTQDFGALQYTISARDRQILSQAKEMHWVTWKFLILHFQKQHKNRNIFHRKISCLTQYWHLLRYHLLKLGSWSSTWLFYIHSSNNQNQMRGYTMIISINTKISSEYSGQNPIPQCKLFAYGENKWHGTAT